MCGGGGGGGGGGGETLEAASAGGDARCMMGRPNICRLVPGRSVGYDGARADNQRGLRFPLSLFNDCTAGYINPPSPAPPPPMLAPPPHPPTASYPPVGSDTCQNLIHEC